MTKFNDKLAIELEQAGYKRLNKIVDTLEQRISKLEKVLASHAKCIGEMREEKTDVEMRENKHE